MLYTRVFFKFFQPYHPVDVYIKVNPRDRRPTGEAEVTFASYDETMRALKYDRRHMNNRYIELFHESSRSHERRTGPHSPPPSPPLSYRHDDRREQIESKPYSRGYEPQKSYYNKAPVVPPSEFNSKPYQPGFKPAPNRYPARAISPPAPPRPPSPPKLPTSSQIYPPYQSKFFNANQTPPNDFTSFQSNYTPFGSLNRAAPVTQSAPPPQVPKASAPYLAANPYTSFVANNTPPLPPSIAPTTPYQNFHNRNVPYQSSMSQSKFSY